MINPGRKDPKKSLLSKYTGSQPRRDGKKKSYYEQLLESLPAKESSPAPTDAPRQDSVRTPITPQVPDTMRSAPQESTITPTSKPVTSRDELKRDEYGYFDAQGDAWRTGSQTMREDIGTAADVGYLSAQKTAQDRQSPFQNPYAAQAQMVAAALNPKDEIIQENVNRQLKQNTPQGQKTAQEYYEAHIQKRLRDAVDKQKARLSQEDFKRLNEYMGELNWSDAVTNPARFLRNTSLVLTQSLPAMAASVGIGAIASTITMNPVAGMVAAGASYSPQFIGEGLTDAAQDEEGNYREVTPRQRAILTGTGVLRAGVESAAEQVIPGIGKIVRAGKPIGKAGAKVASDPLWKRLPKGVGQGAVAEAIGEGGGEVIGQLGQVAVGASEGVNFDEVATGAVYGAGSGGMLGGMGSLKGGKNPPQATQQTNPTNVPPGTPQASQGGNVPPGTPPAGAPPVQPQVVATGLRSTGEEVEVIGYDTQADIAYLSDGTSVPFSSLSDLQTSTVGQTVMVEGQPATIVSVGEDGSMVVEYEDESIDTIDPDGNVTPDGRFGTLGFTESPLEGAVKDEATGVTVDDQGNVMTEEEAESEETQAAKFVERVEADIDQVVDFETASSLGFSNTARIVQNELRGLGRRIELAKLDEEEAKADGDAEAQMVARKRQLELKRQQLRLEELKDRMVEKAGELGLKGDNPALWDQSMREMAEEKKSQAEAQPENPDAQPVKEEKVEPQTPVEQPVSEQPLATQPEPVATPQPEPTIDEQTETKKPLRVNGVMAVDSNGDITKEFLDNIESLKENNDIQGLNDAYTTVRILLNGPAQGSGEKAVQALEKIKLELETFAQQEPQPTDQPLNTQPEALNTQPSDPTVQPEAEQDGSKVVKSVDESMLEKPVEGLEKYDKGAPAPEYMDTPGAGSETEIYVAPKQKVKGRFAVVEADETQASHTLDGNPNALHRLPEAQPRDRTEWDLKHKPRQQAQDMDPALITDGLPIFYGAPVVTTDNMAIQGNGRIMSLQAMYEEFQQNAEAYKQYLINNAAKFGIDPEVIRGMKNPILVRQVPVNDHAAVIMGNVPNTFEAKVSMYDSAKQIVRKLTADMRERIGIILDSSEKETLRAVLDDVGMKLLNVMPFIDRNSDTINSEGKLTDTGKTLLEKVFIALIFDATDTPGAINSYNEAPYAVRMAIEKNIPVILSRLFQPGDLAPVLRQAIKILGEFNKDKDRYGTIDGYLRQGDMMEGYTYENYADDAASMAKALYSLTSGTGASPKVRAYFEKVISLMEGGENSLFTIAEPYGNTPEARAKAIFDALPDQRFGPVEGQRIATGSNGRAANQNDADVQRGTVERTTPPVDTESRGGDTGAVESVDGLPDRPEQGLGGAVGTLRDDGVVGTEPSTGEATRPGLLYAIDRSKAPEPKPLVSETEYDLDEHQLYGVNMALTAFDNGKPAFLLADGTGVGKTRQLLAIADKLKKQGKKVLIISENRTILDNNFQNDAQAMGIDTSGMGMSTYSDIRNGKVDSEYDVVIFDEAHNLKNATSLQAIAARGLKVKHRLFATATPMDTASSSAYFIAETTGISMEDAYQSLGFRLVRDDTGTVTGITIQEGMDFRDIRDNIISMRDKMIQEGTMLRREYPFYGDVERVAPQLTNEQLGDEAMIQDYWDEQEEMAANENGFVPRTKLMSLRGQRSGELSRFNESTKVDFVFDQAMRDIEEGKQVVIIAEGINDTEIKGLDQVIPGFIQAIEKKFADAGIPTAGIYGADKKAKVKANRDFQSGKVQVVIGTPKSASTGIDLDDQVGGKPRKLYMVTPNYSGNIFDQILGRVSRRNTKSAAQVVLVFNDSASDTRRDKIVKKKLDTLKAIQRGELSEEVDMSEVQGTADSSVSNDGQITGDFRFQKISDRAFVVVGDTKPIKDRLKAMGAKWHGGQKGWMFPVSRANEVASVLGIEGPLFKRTDQPFLQSALPKAEATQAQVVRGKASTRALKNQIKKAGLSDIVHVYDSPEDVPAFVLETIDMMGGINEDGSFGVEGAYFPGGDVHIFGWMHKSPKEAQRTFLHEVVGHMGLRRLFSVKAVKNATKEFNDFLEEVIGIFEGSDIFNQIVRNYELSQTDPDHRRLLAEELVAFMAESDPKNQLIDKLINLIRKVLRAAGMELKLTRAELVEVIAESKRAVGIMKDGKRDTVVTNDDVNFARPSDFGFNDDGDIINLTPEAMMEIKEEREGITQKAKADGTWMKAPNGKPTNLNEEQWVTVRTSRFKEWFGDWEGDPENASKVVDDNGEPMVVYHGTNEEFTEFNGYDDLNYFTQDLSYAEDFTDSGIVIRSYLVSKNPIDLSAFGIEDITSTQLITHLEQKGITLTDFEIRNIKTEPEARIWEHVRSNGFAIRKALQRSGFDGILQVDTLSFDERNDNDIDNSYPVVVVFSPNQIKSASTNAGTFNDSTGDIRFQRELDKLEIINGFYSPIEKKIRDFKQESAPAKKWIELLGSKTDEAVYTGVSGWLLGIDPNQKVSKQELMDFMRENRIEIKILERTSEPPDILVQEEYEVESKINKLLLGAFKSLPIEGQKELYNSLFEYEDVFDIENVEDSYSYLENELNYDLNNQAESNQLNVKLFHRLYTRGKEPKGVEELLNKSGEIKESIRKSSATYVAQTLDKPFEFSNYKEVLVTLPQKETIRPLEIYKQGDGTYPWKVRIIGEESHQSSYKTKEEAESFVKKIGGFKEKTGPKFNSSHFNEPNILVHLRTDIRTDVNGDKVLFIEEIQSDWAQRGRDKGFKISIQEQKARNYTPTNGIDQAPFVTNTSSWVKLALKMAIKDAVRSGVDKIAWTTGEQQNDRYNLSKKVDKIDAESIQEAGGVYFVDIFLTSGQKVNLEVENGVVREGQFTGQRLDDVIGKEYAEKILSTPKGQTRTLQGDDLKLGGKGMKAFYDGIVPQVAKALVKELTGKRTDLTTAKLATQKQDVKIGENFDIEDAPAEVQAIIQKYSMMDDSMESASALEAELAPLGYEVDWDMGGTIDSITRVSGKPTLTTQQAIQITPELKEAVSDGMPLFRRASQPNPSPEVRFRRGITITGETPPDLLKARSDWFVKNFQDKYLDSEKMLKQKRREGANIESYQDFMAHERVRIGRVDFQMEMFQESFETKIVNALRDVYDAGLTYVQAQDYLVALHAPERNATIEEANGMKDGSGISDAEAASIIASFTPEEIAVLDKLAEAVHATTRFTLEAWMDGGLITRERYNMLKDGWEYYVPLRGFRDLMPQDLMDLEPDNDITKSFFNSDPTKFSDDKRAKGRTTMAGDVIAYSIQMAKTAIAKKEQNRVKQAMFHLMKEQPDTKRYKIRSIYYIDTGNLDEEGNPIYTAQFTRPTKAQYDAGLVKKSSEITPQANILFPSDRDKNSLTVLVNGRPFVLEFANPEIPMAFKNMSMNKLGTFTLAFQKATGVLRNFYTTYSPEFTLRNLLRDIETGSIHLYQDFGAKDATLITNPARLVSAMRGLRGWIRHRDPSSEWGKYAREFFQQGGATGYYDINNVDGVTRNLLKEMHDPKWKKIGYPIQALGALVSDYNKIVENAMRLSTYRYLTEKKGWDKVKAAEYAKNLTVDFNRKGNMSSGAGSLYLFFNAAIQGSFRMFQGLASDNKWTRRRSALSLSLLTAGGFVMTEMARMMLGDDDDDRDRLSKFPDYTRRLNVIVPNVASDNENDIAMLVLPYGHNVFYYAGVLASDLVHKQTSPLEASFNLLDAMSDSFSPLGGFDSEDELVSIAKILTPTLLKPGVDLLVNRDFADNPINPSQLPYNRQIPDSHNYFRSTGKTYVGVAKALNEMTGGDDINSGGIDLSPGTLEHLVTSYLGTMGRSLSKTVNSSMNIIDAMAGNYTDTYRSRMNVPFASIFYREISPEQPYYDFRENMRKVREADQKVNAYMKESDSKEIGRQRATKYAQSNDYLHKLHDVAVEFDQDIRELKTKETKYREKLSTMKKSDEGYQETRDRLDSTRLSIKEKSDTFNRWVAFPEVRPARMRPKN